MRAFARTLAAFTGRHRRLVLVVWLALVAAAVPLAMRQTENLTGGGFEVPGTQSAAVERALQRDFGQRAGSDAVGAVLRAEPGASPEARAAAVDRLAAAVADIDTLTLDPAAAERAKRELARDGLTIVPIQASADTNEQIDAAVELREELAPGRAVDDVTPYLVGQPAAWAGLQELTREDLEEAELTGFPLVALILVSVFGSLAAAALPLALGFAAVIITGAVIYLLSLQMEMSVFVTNMASMIGIGVAVDYSLFVLARYREEIARGLDPDAARTEALSTSGLAVAFSGMAVIVSLAGIWMVDNQALRSMALGAIVVVAVAIVAAVVLLPAVIGLLGRRVEGRGLTDAVRRRLRLGRPARAAVERAGFWYSWTARVMRRPWLSLACAAGVLLVLASPVLSLKTRAGALSEFPSDHDVRVGVELVREATGGGADPVRVVAEFGDEPGAAQTASAELAELRERFAADPAVAAVGEWAPNEAGTRALLDVFPVQAADSDATLALVERARSEIVPASALAAGEAVNVGGESARIADVRDQISGSMGQILAFILGLSFVLLMLMLRSVLLPLKAVVMNLLSIGAAFGVLVAVFEWGWLDGFAGFESSGALDTINLPLIVAVVFGLSMDYEVFLLSRIRERHLIHGDNKRAVAEGLATSAPTISSAALIMTCVFAVFVLTGVPSIKELGVGLAIAIALDATLVRLVLVPATMQLMGRWNWWLPRWLDRILPDLGFESGEGPRDRAAAPAEA
ncbi:MAG TPA: MMPL family transporter [Solirubrobacterales bacterium]|jgi:RND superfamily putative drug exporter